MQPTLSSQQVSKRQSRRWLLKKMRGMLTSYGRLPSFTMYYIDKFTVWGKQTASYENFYCLTSALLLSQYSPLQILLNQYYEAGTSIDHIYNSTHINISIPSLSSSNHTQNIIDYVIAHSNYTQSLSNSSNYSDKVYTESLNIAITGNFALIWYFAIAKFGIRLTTKLLHHLATKKNKDSDRHIESASTQLLQLTLQNIKSATIFSTFIYSIYKFSDLYTDKFSSIFTEINNNPLMHGNFSQDALCSYQSHKIFNFFPLMQLIDCPNFLVTREMSSFAFLYVNVIYAAIEAALICDGLIATISYTANATKYCLSQSSRTALNQWANQWLPQDKLPRSLTNGDNIEPNFIANSLSLAYYRYIENQPKALPKTFCEKTTHELKRTHRNCQALTLPLSGAIGFMLLESWLQTRSKSETCNGIFPLLYYDKCRSTSKIFKAFETIITAVYESFPIGKYEDTNGISAISNYNVSKSFCLDFAQRTPIPVNNSHHYNVTQLNTNINPFPNDLCKAMIMPAKHGGTLDAFASFTQAETTSIYSLVIYMITACLLLGPAYTCLQSIGQKLLNRLAPSNERPYFISRIKSLTNYIDRYLDKLSLSNSISSSIILPLTIPVYLITLFTAGLPSGTSYTSSDFNNWGLLHDLFSNIGYIVMGENTTEHLQATLQAVAIAQLITWCTILLFSSIGNFVVGSIMFCALPSPLAAPRLPINHTTTSSQDIYQALLDNSIDIPLDQQAATIAAIESAIKNNQNQDEIPLPSSPAFSAESKDNSPGSLNESRHPVSNRLWSCCSWRCFNRQENTDSSHEHTSIV